MQTFLPYADFELSAQSLDSPRLGKQRVETLQILRALELPEYGWANHPAVRMWRGYTPALVLYGLVCARVWRGRGHADSTEAQIAEFAPGMTDTTQTELGDRQMLPPWLGDDALHVSHRSKLVTKDPAHYLPRFAGTPLGLDYFWPQSDAAVASSHGPVGTAIWVIRTESAHIAGTFITEAFVALGTDSGIDADVSGRELPDLQALVEGARRRSGKPMLALSRFLADIKIGNEVGVFIEHDNALLLGRITGNYQFDAKAAHGLVHRRPVSWHGVVTRSSIQPPASLQDVRPVFQVWRHASD